MSCVYDYYQILCIKSCVVQNDLMVQPIKVPPTTNRIFLWIGLPFEVIWLICFLCHRWVQKNYPREGEEVSLPPLPDSDDPLRRMTCIPYLVDMFDPTVSEDPTMSEDGSYEDGFDDGQRYIEDPVEPELLQEEITRIPEPEPVVEVAEKKKKSSRKPRKLSTSCKQM